MTRRAKRKARAKNTAAARACVGKRRHADFASAELARIKTQEATGEVSLVAYRCRHCGKYHVGHAARRYRAELAAKRTLAAVDRAMKRTNKGAGDA